MLGLAVAILAVGIVLHPTPGPTPELRLTYTEQTAEDAEVHLPAGVQAQLEDLGMAGGRVLLTRVGADGTSTTSTASVDLTPRLSNGHVVKVRENALPLIDKKIDDILATVNSADATVGSRALYAGLTKTSFNDGSPIMIISPGLDLAAPDDFRRLNWSQKAIATVLDTLHKNSQQARLPHVAVTFVFSPTTGEQPQLGQREQNFRRTFWDQSLRDAGAESVTFFDAPQSDTAGGSVQAAPVPVPGLPQPPIEPDPPSADDPPGTGVCSVTANYFRDSSALLVDAKQTLKRLRPCVVDAVKAKAKFRLDGYTSYDGPLNGDGKPAIDSKNNRTLSAQRNSAIAKLLRELDVPAKDITTHAHGNTQQPYPQDPRSPKNRVVRVKFTIPDQIKKES